ncbi:hypothetical protein GOBAR_AA04628 [Gossypium barbadense]|uniref:Uncharacterized protein n=1 Tax=Gossypium barbadense TaxID=3634 RepID=A0A2P5YK64_GOSBA|nr:hypothetical protein GOBAR_AA04628 [Gossypium barbadense]
MIMEDTESRKVSFREMLMVNVRGFAEDSVGVTNEGLVNEDFEILEGDVKVSLDGPYLDIFLSDRVQEMLDRNMEQTVAEATGSKVNRPTSRDSWPTPSSGENLDADQSGFGPWMQAPGRKRRAEGKSAAITFGKNPSGDKSSLKSTRFDVLMTLEESKVEGFGEDLTEKLQRLQLVIMESWEAGSSGANGPEMEKTGVKEATCHCVVNVVEVPMEVTEMEKEFSSMEPAYGSLVGVDLTNQTIVVEHGGVESPAAGGLSARQYRSQYSCSPRSGVKADEVIRKTNFEVLYRVEAKGFSCGIWGSM